MKQVSRESTRSTSKKISTHFWEKCGNVWSKYPTLKLQADIFPYLEMFPFTSSSGTPESTLFVGMNLLKIHQNMALVAGGRFGKTRKRVEDFQPAVA